MYRACSTWQYGVVGRLLERFREGSRLGFVDGERFSEKLVPEGWSVLKAHDAHDRFEKVLREGKALAIYSHRDLRDVAFSWMHKTGSTFEQIVERGFFDVCLQNDRFWRSQPGVLLQTYEDLIADPARGVAEIANHLGIEITPEDAREIADTLSLEENRKRTLEISQRLEQQGIPLSSTDQGSFDRETLLHWNHVRDGQVGGWREAATAHQKSLLAAICGAWLIERGYESNLIWGGPPAPVPPKISYAQQMEDIFLDRLFQGRKGTFIDVGANHPTLNNNTYFFYLKGWRGVNVEPVRACFQLFGEKRPEDLNLELAVSDVDGHLPFYEIPDCDGLSSLSSEVAEEQKIQGFRVVERKVPTRTVASLIEQYHLEPPDIFSIDVEGNELQVLKGIPLDRWQPKVFLIESTRPKTNILCHHSWEPILLEHGYLFAAFDGINRYYLRGDLSDSLPLLSYPINTLDFYERIETVELRQKAEWLNQLYHEERQKVHEARAQLEEIDRSRSEILACFHAEREAWQRERNTWQSEREARQSERDTWQVERDGVQAEREAVQGERLAFQAEREESHRRAVAQADELRQVRDDLVRLTYARDAEHASFEEERRARSRQIEETQIQLRPYRLIDRFGVVTALHRRARAVKAKVHARTHRGSDPRPASPTSSEEADKGWAVTSTVHVTYS